MKFQITLEVGTSSDIKYTEKDIMDYFVALFKDHQTLIEWPVINSVTVVSVNELPTIN